MFFKICASISEVQLKKCKVGIFPLTLRYYVCVILMIVGLVAGLPCHSG